MWSVDVPNKPPSVITFHWLDLGKQQNWLLKKQNTNTCTLDLPKITRVQQGTAFSTVVYKYDAILKRKMISSFYAPEIEERGAYCFCPVCHSVIFSETLTLLITFEQWVLELLYFSWIFLLIRSICWYLTFWPWHLIFF